MFIDFYHGCGSSHGFGRIPLECFGIDQFRELLRKNKKGEKTTPISHEKR